MPKPVRKQSSKSKSSAVASTEPVTDSPGPPADFFPCVLLAVTGMSPAVLTETVWALAHETPPVVPERVVVVTTVAGREAIVRQLFTPLARFNNQCAWDALRACIQAGGLPTEGRLRFGTTPDDIRVITALDRRTGRSMELADIRSPQDSDAAADFLLDQIRAVVENPDVRLIASLAGGRKTMGALVYACMTLAAREEDRLTHVLVNEPFDTLREFYFPAQPGGDLQSREGGVASPSKAFVELADVTFIPLRNLFTRELGRPAGTFRRLVELCRDNVRQSTGEHLRFEIDRSHPCSWVNGRKLELAPREHLVLLLLAERAKAHQPALPAYDDLLNELEEFRKDTMRQAPPKDWSNWRHELKSEVTQRDLVRLLSDLRSKARRAGGDAALLTTVLPEKGRCSLEIPAELIFIKD